MTDLIVSTRPPTLADAPGRRSAAIVRALLAHGPVEWLYARGEPGAEPDPWFAEQERLALHAIEAARGARRRVARLRARALGVPLPYVSDAAPALAEAAARLLAPRVIAGGAAVAAALLGLARERPVIYDAAELVSLDPPVDLPLRARRELRSFERGLLRESAEAWLPSVAALIDAEDLCGEVAARVVPAAIELAAIAPEPVEPARAGRALVLGDFRRDADRAGLALLVESALPAVWAAHPEIELTVLGPAADAVAPADGDERVRRVVTAAPPLGWPRAELGAEARACVAAAGCLIAPSLEDDEPLRVAELLAHGLPVVATDAAVTGLDALGGIHHVPATPTRAGLAIAIVEALHGDGAASIGARGRELVERDHSVEALARQLAPVTR